jgi:hypothetical protein
LSAPVSVVVLEPTHAVTARSLMRVGGPVHVHRPRNDRLADAANERSAAHVNVHHAGSDAPRRSDVAAGPGHAYGELRAAISLNALRLGASRSDILAMYRGPGVNDRARRGQVRARMNRPGELVGLIRRSRG